MSRKKEVKKKSPFPFPPPPLFPCDKWAYTHTQSEGGGRLRRRTGAKVRSGRGGRKEAKELIFPFIVLCCTEVIPYVVMRYSLVSSREEVETKKKASLFPFPLLPSLLVTNGHTHPVRGGGRLRRWIGGKCGLEEEVEEEEGKGGRMNFPPFFVLYRSHPVCRNEVYSKQKCGEGKGAVERSPPVHLKRSGSHKLLYQFPLPLPPSLLPPAVGAHILPRWWRQRREEETDEEKKRKEV